jgi:hypothetical protein
MGKENKAHTAAANRIAARYGGTFNPGDGHDIQVPGLIIEVETTATLRAAIRHLKGVKGPVFVAVTNKEGVHDALQIARTTRVGVMNPQGDILKQSDPPWEG